MTRSHLASLFAFALAGTAAGQSVVLVPLRRMLPEMDHSTSAVRLADLDGDGDLDLYSGAGNAKSTVQRNDNGRFEVVPDAIPGGATASDVVLADLDGDGDLDALHGGTNRLFAGDGTGVFVELFGHVPSTVTTVMLAVGDVDLDGDLDVFAAGADSLVGATGDHVLRNDGTSVFAAIGVPSFQQTTDGALADLDGDGDLDLALARIQFNFEYGFPQFGYRDILQNDGAGGFAYGAFLGTSEPVWSVVAADLDGDGDRDLVFGTDAGLSTGGSGLDELWVGDGFGAFTAAAGLPANAGTTNAILAVDLDGDLDLDLVLGTGAANAPELVYRNDGGLAFTDLAASIPKSTRITHAVAAGDVDGDGDVDLAFADAGPDRLWLQGPGLTFADTASPLPELGWLTTPRALGDVDGDGAPDLFASGGPSAPNALARNDGSGVFASAPGALPSTAFTTGDAAFGDVDQDGDQDLLLANTNAADALFRNDGTGVFAWNPSDTPADVYDTVEALLGDLDGDGDLDAYAAVWNAADRVHANDGTGVFTVVGGAVPDALSTASACLGDLDGDGDLDVLRGLTSTAESDWLANDGAGGFSSGGAFAGVQAYMYVALAADVQGNGRLDAFFGDAINVRQLRNDGAGAFTDVSAALFYPFGAVDLAAADLDGDGDLDLIGATTGDFQSPVFVNDGTGSFSDGTALIEVSPTADNSVLVADLDLDGDDDVLFGRWDADVILTGTRTQLARRALPRIGKPLSLDVYGPAGELWGVAFAFATTKLDLGALGLLQLDPMVPITVLGSGLLDAAGRASVTVTLPANPALVGLSIGTQALTGSVQPRFTNLERIVATDL